MAVRRSPKPLVGVRFPPPEPFLMILKEFSMKYVNFILPGIVTLLCTLGIVTNYYSGNNVAMNANITGAIGWLIITANGVVDFLENRTA